MLSRLLNRLASRASKAFVHIDARANIADFATAFDSASQSVAVATERRTQVNWCGFGMVEATLSLLKLAFEQPVAYDRFVLLSGADYPIKPNHLIANILSEEKNFLQVDRQLDPDGKDWFDDCANHPFLGDISVLNPRIGSMRFAGWARRLERCIKRAYPPGLSVYYGPAWWCLTRETVTEFMRHEHELTELVRWFRWCRSPDEMVFQTLIKRHAHPNIKWDATSSGGSREEVNCHALHYVDFRNPNPDAPRTLVASDFDSLTRSSALFARKCSTNKSTRLLDRLDNEVLCS